MLTTYSGPHYHAVKGPITEPLLFEAHENDQVCPIVVLVGTDLEEWPVKTFLTVRACRKWLAEVNDLEMNLLMNVLRKLWGRDGGDTHYSIWAIRYGPATGNPVEAELVNDKTHTPNMSDDWFFDRNV